MTDAKFIPSSGARIMIKEHQSTLWAGDLAFLEAPRWHQGRLWVSDVFGNKLHTVQPGGSTTL